MAFRYDALGRRVQRVTPAETRYFVWDGDDVLVELASDGTRLAEHANYPGMSRPHSVRLGANADSVFYYLMDESGNTRGLVDQNGMIVGEVDYAPFGERTSTIPELGVALGYFAGLQADVESGFYYARARYYDPEIGRFVSEDPIGLEGGVNLYGYALNDPINNADPSGLNPRLATVYVEGVNIPPELLWLVGQYMGGGELFRRISRGIGPRPSGGRGGARSGRTTSYPKEEVLACVQKWAGFAISGVGDIALFSGVGVVIQGARVAVSAGRMANGIARVGQNAPSFAPGFRWRETRNAALYVAATDLAPHAERYAASRLARAANRLKEPPSGWGWVPIVGTGIAFFDAVKCTVDLASQ